MVLHIFNKLLFYHPTMTRIILCFIILTVLQQYDSALTETEQDVLLALSNEFMVQNLVMVTDFDIEAVSLVKHMSKYNIRTALQSVNQMNLTLHEKKWFESKTIIVLHVKGLIRSLDTLFWITKEGVLPQAIWVLFRESDSKQLIEKYAYIPYNCEFLLAMPVENTGYTIVELYHTRIGWFELHQRDFGQWTKDGGLVTTSQEFYQRRLDMKGTVLGVQTLSEAGSLECSVPEVCAYKEMVKEMGRVMNFSQFYTRLWDEEEAELQVRVDVWPEMSLGLYVFDSITFRRTVVAPIWKSPVYLHIAYDVVLEQGEVSPLKRPLTTEVWTAILVWVLMSGICIVFIDYCVHVKTGYEAHNKFHVTSTCFRPLESFSNQCGSRISKASSVRIATIFTRVLPAVIYPAYSAAVLSFITIRYVKLPFTDLQGLVQDGTYKIGFENNTIIRIFFYSFNETVTQLALERNVLEPEEMITNTEEGIARLCGDKKLAFVNFNNYVYREKRICRILQIPKPVFYTWDAIVLRTDSPYKSIFNRLLNSFRSAGILKRMEGIVYGRSPEVEKEKAHDPIELGTLLSLYKLLTVTYLISVVLLLIELLRFGAVGYKKSGVK